MLGSCIYHMTNFNSAAKNFTCSRINLSTLTLINTQKHTSILNLLTKRSSYIPNHVSQRSHNGISRGCGIDPDEVISWRSVFSRRKSGTSKTLVERDKTKK